MFISSGLNTLRIYEIHILYSQITKVLGCGKTCLVWHGGTHLIILACGRQRQETQELGTNLSYETNLGYGVRPCWRGWVEGQINSTIEKAKFPY